MAAQKSLPFGTTETTDDVLFVELALVLTSTGDGAKASGYTAFNNAFGATPTIISVAPPNGATPCAVAAEVNATGITLHASPVSAGALMGATLNVSAVVRGKLA